MDAELWPDDQPAPWRWYITAEACRQYVAIAGGDFAAARKALGEISLAARLVHAMGEASRDAAIYRHTVTIAGRRVRLELSVAETPRDEGPLSQLVRVRRK